MPTGTATASGPNAANVGAVNSAANAALAGSAIDVQAVYDMLGELDEREAKREPMHSPIVTVYAPNADSESGVGAATMTIDGISAYIPAIDRDYLIDSSQLAAIQRLIKRVSVSGRPANIGLYSEPGSGKTTLGIQIAAMRRGPVVVCEASAWQTPDEVYATMTGIDRESGAVQARASRFVMGIETPGATVVINDVANLQNPRVQNGLNELLDPSTRSTFVEVLGRAVRVAPGVVIVGTWNTNTISATELSGQILDRFASGLMFEVPLPTNGALAHILTARTGINRPGAQRLAALAEWMRNDADPIPVATRRLIAAAEEVVDGASIGHAIAYTIFAELDATERARAYQIIAVNIGDADQNERDAWATPISGDYLALGDVISESDSESGPEGASNDNAS
jgi:MoxR-like ATPase